LSHHFTPDIAVIFLAGTRRRNRRRREGTITSVKPRKSLRAVAARDSGRWGGAEGQAPSGPCDPYGRTVLLSHV